jgi:predicted amidohydrolase YtcJ
MRTLIAALLWFTFISCTAPAPEADSTPTEPSKAATGTLFVGGTLVAGPEQTPQENYAVYVTDGIIRDLGPADGLRKKYPEAMVVDASKATILPGLIDAHGHLYGLGNSLDIVRLANTTSYEEVIARVRERAAQTPAGEWVVGRGWDQNDWPTKAFPTSAPLDAAVSTHPVWLTRIDGHAGLANSAAMKLAGVTAATKDPAGGRIERDAQGNPTGVFIDAATDLIDNAIPAPSPAQRKARVLASAQAIAASGLTGMHDAGIDAATITAVKELIAEKKFPIRVYGMLGDNTQLVADWFKQGPMIDHGGRLTVRSVKLYADGALGSRGAALLAPYSDDPKNVGLMVSTLEHIEDVTRRGKAAGFQINAHAIGDRGVRTVIDAYEKAGVTAADRYRIEHLQVIAPEDIPRLVKSGIIASMQPTHATSDMYWAEERVGPERVKGAYAWRTVLNAGGRLAFGSDFPVEDVNPFFGLLAAVTRQDQKGWPEGGWRPTERLTLAEAIRGFTIDAAYAAFEEKSRGTIEAGKLADFTIVDGDLYALPSNELHKAVVTMTVVNGEVVYEKK